MTKLQRLAFIGLIKQAVKYLQSGQTNLVPEFHHGDCIGADAEAANIFRLCISPNILVSHPPLNPSKRAYVLSAEVRPEKEYLERNQDIVNETAFLIACPKEFAGEELRSGTWSTVRYARKVGKRVTIVRPDGTIKHE
jgi:hypothetical protein